MKDFFFLVKKHSLFSCLCINMPVRYDVRAVHVLSLLLNWLTCKLFGLKFWLFEIDPCRIHFLSMPSVGLYGRILRVSYLSLNMLYQHHRKCSPLRTLEGSWYDALSTQLLFLVQIIYKFLKWEITMQAYTDAINGHKLQNGHANHAWLCLDLLDVLCQLAEKGHASFVRSILDHPLKHCPEVLLLGMAHINVQFNEFIFIGAL